MKPAKTCARRRLGGAAIVLCFVAASPLWADGADLSHKTSGAPAATPGAATASPATSNLPAAAPAEAQKPAQPSLEGQLQEELARLRKLEAELKAIESAPIPDASLPAAKAQEKKPAPSPAEVPKEPVKGLEEEFANALYALRKYDSASAAYRKLLESKPKADVQAWARFQIANCAKRAGDFPAAATAYEELLTTSPTCPWAPEAAWWANEIKWRMRWDQTAQ